MKKREKTLRLNRETIRDLGALKPNREILNQVVGGSGLEEDEPCVLPSSHFPHYCP